MDQKQFVIGSKEAENIQFCNRPQLSNFSKAIKLGGIVNEDSNCQMFQGTSDQFICFLRKTLS